MEKFIIALSIFETVCIFLTYLITQLEYKEKKDASFMGNFMCVNFLFAIIVGAGVILYDVLSKIYEVSNISFYLVVSVLVLLVVAWISSYRNR